MPLARMRVDQQQCGRGSERCALFRPRARIRLHAQLRFQARKRFGEAAAEIIRQRTHALNRKCSAWSECDKRGDVEFLATTPRTRSYLTRSRIPRASI